MSDYADYVRSTPDSYRSERAANEFIEFIKEVVSRLVDTGSNSYIDGRGIQRLDGGGLPYPQQEGVDPVDVPGLVERRARLSSMRHVSGLCIRSEPQGDRPNPKSFRMRTEIPGTNDAARRPNSVWRTNQVVTNGSFPSSYNTNRVPRIVIDRHLLPLLDLEKAFQDCNADPSALEAYNRERLRFNPPMRGNGPPSAALDIEHVVLGRSDEAISQEDKLVVAQVAGDIEQAVEFSEESAGLPWIDLRKFS